MRLSLFRDPNGILLMIIFLNLTNLSCIKKDSNKESSVLSWSNDQMSELKNSCVENFSTWNSNIFNSAAAVYCSCVIEKASTKWAYDEFLRNTYTHTEELKNDGTINECLKSANIKNGWTTDAISQVKGNCIDAGIAMFSSAPIAVLSSYCGCGIEDAVKRWSFDDYIANESTYVKKQTDEGVLKKCIEQSGLEKYSTSLETTDSVKSGVWTDPKTGLSWTFLPATKGGSLGLVWDKASQACTDLSIGSNSEWRLPSVQEIKNTLSNRLLDKLKDFRPVGATYVWSSDAGYNGTDSSSAQTVSLDLETSSSQSKLLSNYALCVMEGQFLPPLEDSSGNSGSVLDPPKLNSVTINQGNQVTSSLYINVTIDGSGASNLYITENDDCSTGGEERNFRANFGWSVHEVDREIVIYVKLKNDDGVESPCVKASIGYLGGLLLNVDFGNDFVPFSNAKIHLKYSKTTTRIFLSNEDNNCTSGGTWVAPTTNLNWVMGTNSWVYSKAEFASGQNSLCQKFSTLDLSNSCVVYRDGLLKCWGNNYNGELGLGDKFGRQLSQLTSNGLQSPVDLGTGLKAKKVVRQINFGGSHTCVILTNDQVKCFGRNSYGQLGLGDVEDRGDSIDEMGDQLPFVNLGSGLTVKQLALGSYHTCAILNNDRVKCWGSNSSGELGLEDTNNRGDNLNEMGDNLPFVDLGAGRTVKKLFAGNSFNCAILDNDRIKCWGFNYSGQLGLESNLSKGRNSGEMGDNLQYVNLGANRTVKDLSLNGHVCAILDDNSVKCWGNNNSYGALGVGSANVYYGRDLNTMGDNLQIINLGTGRFALQISVGDKHSCALLDNNQVKCWGKNNYGQLGIGNTFDLGQLPNQMGDNLMAVDLGTNLKITKLISWYNNNCVLFEDNTVKCWGYNFAASIGIGTSSYGDQPGEMGEALPFLPLDL